MSLDNLSLWHDDLRDQCKPFDGLTDDIMGDAVDCAAAIFSECMSKEEENMIFVEMLENFA